MALFGPDYDRDYGYGPRGRPGRTYGAGWGGYDRGFRGGYGGTEYDAGYKSRWQTDVGDPYGDRANRTPMRMIRGDFHGYGEDYRPAQDRGFRGGVERPPRYGRSPMGYDPYQNRGGYQGRPGRWNREGWNRESPGYRGYSENRYDAGWF